MKRITFKLCATFVLLLSAAIQSSFADITVSGAWTQNGDEVRSQPVNLEQFRSHFEDVLQMYEMYKPIARELANGIEEVEPISLIAEQGRFAILGYDVGFNPLATGGTTDIATGGEYIDQQLSNQKQNFEVAQVDVDDNVFRQDFGPVQTSQRQNVSGNLDWYRFNFLAINGRNDFPESDFFQQNLSATVSSIPEPNTVLFGFACSTILIMRRSRH